MEYLIKTNSIGGMTDEQFFNFCQENDMLRIERNANGDIILMAPTGSEMGWINSSINLELGIWNKQKKLGYVFDSSTGLPFRIKPYVLLMRHSSKKTAGKLYQKPKENDSPLYALIL